MWEVSEMPKGISQFQKDLILQKKTVIFVDQMNNESMGILLGIC